MEVLNSPVIDMKALRKTTFRGIPDEVKGLRPIVWRLMLGALPLETTDWEAKITSSKEAYETYKKELIIQPELKKAEETKKAMDHPLSVSPDSTWNKFFADQELWDEIEKDVKRTRTDLSFFA